MGVERREPDWDSVIVGGGPAGLSAALNLGRARRRVLIFDAGEPRNAAAHEMHGFLGHDGIAPLELRTRGRAELERYGIAQRGERVETVRRNGDVVEVVHAGGVELARTVVLATGLADDVPQVDGFADIWGKSAHNCPYCDGWEHRDRDIAVYGGGPQSGEFALLVRQWSPETVLVTDGPHELGDELLLRLRARGVEVVTDAIRRLASRDGQLQSVVFADGHALPRQALFFSLGRRPRVALGTELGCELRNDGTLQVDEKQQTTVERVYAAGNCADGRAQVAWAAADGSKAAIAINARLVTEDVDAASKARASTG